MTRWEAVAVILAVAYLLLAVRQNLWCWACAAVSTTIYLVLMYQAKLYSESALQVFYIAMAGYGWYQWRFHPGQLDRLPVRTWSVQQHLTLIGTTTAAALCLGWLMGHYTDAAFPYLDAMTTCYAVVTTYMVAPQDSRKLVVLVCHRRGQYLPLLRARLSVNRAALRRLPGHHRFRVSRMASGLPA